MYLYTNLKENRNEKSYSNTKGNPKVRLIPRGSYAKLPDDNLQVLWVLLVHKPKEETKVFDGRSSMEAP